MAWLHSCQPCDSMAKSSTIGEFLQYTCGMIAKSGNNGEDFTFEEKHVRLDYRRALRSDRVGRE